MGDLNYKVWCLFPTAVQKEMRETAQILGMSTSEFIRSATLSLLRDIKTRGIESVTLKPVSMSGFKKIIFEEASKP